MGMLRRSGRGLRAAAAAVALAAAVSACGSNSSSGDGDDAATTPRRGGTITIDWVSNPTSLDPLKYNVFGSFNVYSLIYSTLYRWDEDGNLHPELASDQPKVSEDGLTYTIPLRNDVTWHDGSRFTSKDVAHTINAVINPKNGATWYAALSPIKEVKTPDDTTVELTLSRPHSVLQGMLAQVPIISSSKPYVPDETWASTAMGTGPFKFVRWDQGSQVILERNENYFIKDLPYVDRVVMRIVKEDAARIANISGGNSDVMPMVPFNQIETLKARGVNVTITPKSALMPTLFPSQKKSRPTSNAHFRKAIALAIDRGQIAEVVFKGAATPASTLMASGTQYWNEQLGTAYGDKPNLEQAKAEMEAAGVKPGTKIELVTRNEPTATAVGTIIQSNLKELGLDVQLSPEEAASYLPKLLSGDFDLMLLDIEGGITSGFTPMYMYAALHSSSHSNYIKFTDPKMDELLVNAMSDPKDPEAAWRAVQEYELEVVPYIATVTARYVEANSKRLKGYTPSSLFSLRNLDRAWIAE
ncbi:MAG TPA: ABC transporter substrate-binding protein [Micromonospora sp.]